MIRSVLLLTTSLLCTGALAGNDIAKWVDKDGRVHYGDQPPTESVKEVTHLKKSRQPTPVAAAEGSAPAPRQKTPAEESADFKARQVKKAEAEAEQDKKAKEAALKEKHCNQAQNQLKNLQPGHRVTRTNAQGEAEFMNDKEIEEARREQADYVKQNCSPS